MIQKKYIVRINEIIKTYLPDTKAFIYGSALYKKKFRDVDIGFINTPDKKKLIHLEEALDTSTLPYFVELVDFSKVKEPFKEEVFKNKVLWLQDTK